MPRRSYKKNIAKIEPVYKSIEVTKLINYITIDGKKSVAERIVYNVIDRLNKETSDGLKALKQAIQNVAPVHEVKPRRLGGASYLVPTEIRQERKLYLSLNWIINAAKTRANKEYHTFVDKLYAEIQDAAKNQGAAITKKLQTEKLAEANKAFSHLKW
jgi:small subunit ribosomal protein S7